MMRRDIVWLRRRARSDAPYLCATEQFEESLAAAMNRSGIVWWRRASRRRGMPYLFETQQFGQHASRMRPEQIANEFLPTWIQVHRVSLTKKL
jgi:type IV secretory pathway TrbF-like protein